MRHRKSGRKFNKNSSHRSAMFRNMVTSLFKYDRIKTTDQKAKELRKLADHVVTLAKRGDLHARRQALSIVREKDVVYKLFDEADERFGTIMGGYTRIIKIGMRHGDSASISLIELVAADKAKKTSPDQKKKSKIEKEAEPVKEEKVVTTNGATEAKAESTNVEENQIDEDEKSKTVHKEDKSSSS